MSNTSQKPIAPATVLLVEDDAMVRRMTCHMLIKMGMRVIEAAGGSIALERLAEAGPQGIDLVLSDLLMPGMCGAELVAAIRKCNPAIKILLTSGMADMTSEELPSDTAFLQKPYRMKELSEKILSLFSPQPA